jgi:hypothetical protein
VARSTLCYLCLLIDKLDEIEVVRVSASAASSGSVLASRANTSTGIGERDEITEPLMCELVAHDPCRAQLVGQFTVDLDVPVG